MTIINRLSNNVNNALIFLDPCPVCGTNHANPNNPFCSARCTGLANTFRRKMRTNLVRLQILDFRLEFVHSTFPNIHLPSYATQFYPAGETSFFVYGAGKLNIQHPDLCDLWDNIKYYLGNHAYKFIVEQNMKPTQKVTDWRQLFKMWLTLGLSGRDTHFICDQCNQLYLKSGLTSWSVPGCCEACCGEKRPF